MKTFIKLSLVILFVITFVVVKAQDQQQRQLAQPVLMALPAAMEGSDPLTTYKKNQDVQAAATAINQVLTERKLEVRDLKQQITNFDRLRSKMENLRGDMNALIAASSGADVYLEYSLEIVKEGPAKKANILINVKEAATAKMLGASQGVSEAVVTNDISSLATIAVNNCIDRVMEQIRGYWSEIPKRGKPIILTISSKKTDLTKIKSGSKRFDRELANLLKNNTYSYRREMSTKNTLQFNPVYIDAFKFDDLQDFADMIQDFMEGFKLDPDVGIEGKSIEIQIK